MSRVWSWLSRRSWFICVVAGSVLRAWQVGVAPAWYDEIVTGIMAASPLDKMLSATAGDVHPPLWYAILWVIVHITGITAPWMMRLPSVVFSIAALVMARGVMGQLGMGRRAIVIATALLSFSPFQIWYAQEARMYALLEMLFAGALWASLGRRWKTAAVLHALMLWTHNYGAIYSLISIAAGLVRIRSKRDLLPIALCGVGSLASYVPWVAVLMGQVAAMRGGWWQVPTSLGSMAEMFYEITWGQGLPASFVPGGALLTFGLLAASLIGAVVARQAGPLIMALCVVGAPALAVAIEVFYRPVFLQRAMIGSSLMLYCLIGWRLSIMPDLWRRVIIAGLVPYCAISMLWVYPAEVRNKGPFFTSNGISDGNIFEFTDPDDVIMHVNSGTWVSYYPLAHGRDNWPRQCVLPQIPGTLGGLSDQTLDAIGVERCGELDTFAWRRAWLVWGAGPTVSGAEDIAVRDILARYPHTQYYSWPDSLKTQDGGIWLLTR